MGKKLYVGNLPFSATDQILADTFAQCGTVESAKIIMDRDSGRSKGFGFVEMENAEDAIAALNDSVVYGRPLRVNEALERPEGDRGSRGGFGGGQRRSFGGPRH